MAGPSPSPSHAVEHMSELYYGEDKDVIRATLDLKRTFSSSLLPLLPTARSPFLAHMGLP